jgi:Fic family protein
LAAAENALGRLCAPATRGFNPFLIAFPLLRRDAILSSRMEGTITTPEELLLFELGGADAVQNERREDNQEVANYIAAMGYATERLRTLPLNLRFLTEVHEKLLSNVRGGDDRPGEFRRTQNWIGARRGQAITEARYVPPPTERMHECLNDFEKYIHIEESADVSPLLVRLALLHYQFEAIHPFRDGNGRIGRLLIPLILQTTGRMPAPILYISSALEKQKDAYVDLMLSVSQTGDWQAWVEFFLNVLTASAEDAIQRSDRLVDLREKYRRELQGSGVSSRLLQMVDHLFQHPATTISNTAEHLGVSSPGAWNIVRKLVERGVLREMTGKARNKVFVADAIVAITADV